MNSPYPLIEVLHQGQHWILSPMGTDSRSSFGGPLMEHLKSKVSLRKASIHHLGILNLPKFGVGPKWGFSLPLLYGICHEGCEMRYRKTATSAIEITSLDPPKVDVGYPYDNYPAIIPFYMLAIDSQCAISNENLKDRLYNTGWDTSSSLLYAIVLQHPHVGHCLFEGDFDPEVVFEFNTETGEVRATNQCG